MACVVCQHCQGRMLKNDVITIREGYSYHEKCHKCYVCSETNLLNAEIFKGVIFCYNCSQRIFQGCSTARRSKNGNRTQSARDRRPTRRERSRKRHQERQTENSRTHHTNGVIELARLAGSTDTDSYGSGGKEKSRLSGTLAASADLALHGKGISEENSKSMKKESIEMGMTTEVTQELLKQMNCPVVTDRKYGVKQTSQKLHQKGKGDTTFNKTIICSDLRIAELGASTEIAHMALRKRSEVPVIIKSESNMKAMDSLTLSGINQESDVSGEGKEDWLESTYSLKQPEKTRWLDRRIGSIMKMPYKSFKKNILDRSSLITVLMTSDRHSRIFFRKLKMLFHEEIPEHQHRGVKRLYSTINRRKIPYKLGWLNLVSKISAKCMQHSETVKPEIAKSTCNKLQSFTPTRCKHHRTHSYRCMRAQVMRLAGPTKSELAAFRNKIKKTIIPKFVKDIIRINKKYSAIMMSQACGSEGLGSAQRSIQKSVK